ncbi:MAG: LysM peptidoglycan-binding domain-containing protein [Chloroflexi bacterium]|nr:LysM peptidoglycan-binding domain-containing protein [Chloroflexota bacterium]
MSYQPPYKTIESYRRRQRYGPVIIGGLSLLLIAIGLLFLWLWLSDTSLGSLALFATDVPSPTYTSTPLQPSVTPSASAPPTETLPPTVGPTPTADAPFEYTVESEDTLGGLAERFGLDPEIGYLIIQDLNNWTPGRYLQVGEVIIIPPPGTILFTPTPIPPNLSAGTEIIYRVLPGDTLASIAAELLSTIDAIIEANDILDPDQIGVGDLLFVPIGLVTPAPTNTPVINATSTSSATAVP